MNRLFGTSNKKTEAELLADSNNQINDLQKNLQGKINNYNVEITTINSELKMLNTRLKKQPSNQILKRKCLKLLNKRKNLETIVDQLETQIWSTTKQQLATDNLMNNCLTLQTMQQQHKLMQKQFKKINVDKLQDMQDEMADLMEQSEELQNVLNQGFDNGNLNEDLDEDELDQELDALMDEEFEFDPVGQGLENELDSGEIVGETTAGKVDYLNNAMPKFVDEVEEKKVELA
ncbi:hypothetical protein ACO0QE_001406 [Hanseniaspora vineae]